MKRFIERILAFFGISIFNNEYNDNITYTRKYQDIQETNVTAIVSNKLSNITMTDSDIYVAIKTGDENLIRDKNALKKQTNKRVELLNKVAKLLDKDYKVIVNRMLGTGGVVVVPKLNNDMTLGYTIVSQERLIIVKQDGNKIVEAKVIADVFKIKNDKYYHMLEYRAVGSDLEIVSVVRNENGEQVENDLNDNFIIPNVDKCLFGYFKSPVDNRKDSNLYGVPITYGCDKTISRIIETLNQIDTEFKNAESKIFADKRFFDSNDELSSVYKKVKPSIEGPSAFEVFNPNIRDSAYYSKLTNLFKILEKEIGLSDGTLTEMVTQNATATEIKKAMLDTYAMVTEIRKSIERGLDELFYSFNVYANYYSLTPVSDYKMIYDWSYLLIENTQETFDQLERCEALGVVDKLEIRQFLFNDETLEESQLAIDKIKKDNPSIDSLLNVERRATNPIN